MGKDPDVWDLEYREAKKLLEDIQKRLSERNKLLNDERDTAKFSSATRRKITSLETKIARLQALNFGGDRAVDLDDQELEKRSNIIQELSLSVKKLTSSLNDSTVSKGPSNGGYLGIETQLANAEAISKMDNRGVVQLQRKMMEEQDETLLKMESSVLNTKHIALAINSELDLHNRLLGDIQSDMDTTDSRMKAAQRRVLALTKQAGKTCNVIFVILGILAFTLIAVFLSKVAVIF